MKYRKKSRMQGYLEEEGEAMVSIYFSTKEKGLVQSLS